MSSNANVSFREELDESDDSIEKIFLLLANMIADRRCRTTSLFGCTFIFIGITSLIITTVNL